MTTLFSDSTRDNTPDVWRAVFPAPRADSNKYTRGVALVAGGAKMTGAARLAARAAQRVGAGLVLVNAPELVAPIYAQALASCIIRTESWDTVVDEGRFNALLIGCGYGVSEATKQAVQKALASGWPCVLDADALTSFSENPAELLRNIPANTILTPHEGEFARLFDGAGDRLTRASCAAVETGAIVVLKGAETVIAAPDGTCLVNRNAPPTLATAGAGDVLAGLIVGLLAQGMPPVYAAAAGVWLHGEAARRFGAGLIAEDLETQIPAVLQDFLKT